MHLTLGHHYFICTVALLRNGLRRQSMVCYMVQGKHADPLDLLYRPASVDLTLAAFKALYGEETDDKDTVISNLQWTLSELVRCCALERKYSSFVFVQLATAKRNTLTTTATKQS